MWGRKGEPGFYCTHGRVNFDHIINVTISTNVRIAYLLCEQSAAIALFSKWAFMINKLLDVPELAPDDPFPSHIC